MPRTNEHLIQYPGELGKVRLQYIRRRAQAKFRKEQFDLTWEDYQTLWKDHISKIGRTAENFKMTRKDKTLPWSLTNCIVLTVKEINEELGKQRLGMKYNQK